MLKRAPSSGTARRHSPDDFYYIGPDFRRVVGLDYARIDQKRIRRLFEEQRNAAATSERLLLYYIKKNGRMPRDLEPLSDWWLISDAMKSALKKVADQACAFIPCDIILENSEIGQTLWLCDVLPIIDAVDELASDIRLEWRGDRKSYCPLGLRNVVFDRNKVSANHIFRMEFLPSTIVCDAIMKAACTTAKIKGIRFKKTNTP